MPRGRSASHLLCAGRPVCDVKVSAKELIRAKSYDLPELASHILQTSHQPLEHEDILRAFRCVRSEVLFQFVLESWVSMSFMISVLGGLWEILIKEKELIGCGCIAFQPLIEYQ